MRLFVIFFISIVSYCNSYNILAIFPHDGKSHHIFFSSLIEELANKDHNVTVINYHPLKQMPRLKQISLQGESENSTHNVDIEGQLKLMSSDILLAYDAALAFKDIANTNCKKMMTNTQIQALIDSNEIYDVVIVEQFVSDCGLAIAYKLNAATVGMTTHVLMPWTYSRLGASNNPAYVPNRRCSYGTRPNLFNRIKSAIINLGLNMYYTNVIQKGDQEIVNAIYPEVPSLESLGQNMSLIMLNQYFPLTGPRIYGPNVIEIGGMHINNQSEIRHEALLNFLNTSEKGVVYISFGTVATNLPSKIITDIKKVIEETNLNFVWKTDITDWASPGNVFLDKWIAQVPVLCHPKVVAFVTHSGMLSTSEAMYCGVPVVGVPLIGDQFANGASAVESGLGVTVDVSTFNQRVLQETLTTVFQDKYQKRAKKLSQLWKDRPLPPMDTAIYWIEYVARHKGEVNLKPPTVDLPLYQYFMIDLFLVFGSVAILFFWILLKLCNLIVNLIFGNRNDYKRKSKEE